MLVGLLILATCYTGESTGNSGQFPAVCAEDDTAKVKMGKPGGIDTVSLPKSRGERDYSSIQIGFFYLGEMLIVDSMGRKTGFDVTDRSTYQEIPNSSYIKRYIENPHGGSRPESKQLEIMRPDAGDYRLDITGTSDSTYNLGIACYCNQSGTAPSLSDFDGISLITGEVHIYMLNFDKTPEAKSIVTGGFDGGGSEESSVEDKFLSYVNVTETNTTLPPGTQGFNLFIIYGKTVLPETFVATLNASDVSNLFTPKIGGYDIVSIPLVAGENSLALSITGADAGAQDTDSLMFVVE